MPHRQHQFLIPFCIAAIALAGCGGAEENLNRPATYPVTGIVTLNGNPVADAQITFYSTAGGDAAHSAFGRTDAEGRYELTTFEAGDGAVPGEYLVTAKKFDTPPPPEASEDASMDNYVPPSPTDKPPAPPKNELPAQYAARQSTPLKATIKEGENEIPLKLGE